MTKIAGRKASLYLSNAAGACQSFSTLTSNITLNFNSETTDVTGFGDDNRERVADGIRDWELSMDGFWASGATETDAVLAAIRAAGGSTMFKLGPAGSTASPCTCPMYTACGVLTNYECNFTAQDAAKISFTVAARTGSLTRVSSSAYWG